MRGFRVWAPARGRVELVAGGRRHGMRRVEHGWWEADGVAAEPGMRYGFSLEGGEVRPDPRSPSQPDGVLGLSEVVDQEAHRWRDDAWRGRPLAGSVIYELHVGTFSSAGSFDGVIEHLPHLVDLGVDAVEIMPVNEFEGVRGWGYDGVDLFAPHHAYGGPSGLKRLVDACHAAGLATVLDVVYNHLGPVGNFLAEFGPYFSDRHKTEWGPALNFDGPGSDEVRRYIIDNALMWLRDYHFDGLRLDAVHAIVDQTPVHVLEQLQAEVEALGEELHRTVFLIAESDSNDSRLVRPRDAGGLPAPRALAVLRPHAVVHPGLAQRLAQMPELAEIEVVAGALAGQRRVHSVVPIVRPRRLQLVATGVARAHQAGVVRVGLGDQEERAMQLIA